VIPDPFDGRVATHVAVSVANAAMETGVSRKNVNVEEIKMHLLTPVKEK
jgi:malate dehydrogenase (oxaloacetate-decarboxylating)